MRRVILCKPMRENLSVKLQRVYRRDEHGNPSKRVDSIEPEERIRYKRINRRGHRGSQRLFRIVFPQRTPASSAVGGPNLGWFDLDSGPIYFCARAAAIFLNRSFIIWMRCAPFGQLETSFSRLTIYWGPKNCRKFSIKSPIFAQITRNSPLVSKNRL